MMRTPLQLDFCRKKPLHVFVISAVFFQRDTRTVIRYINQFCHAWFESILIWWKSLHICFFLFRLILCWYFACQLVVFKGYCWRTDRDMSPAFIKMNEHLFFITIDLRRRSISKLFQSNVRLMSLFFFLW